MTEGYYRGYPAHAPQQPAHTGISTRVWLALGVVVLLVLTVTVLNLWKVDQVIYKPGPVFDTLGANIGGADDQTQLIQIEGLETFPTSGELALTTVRVSGGPGQTVTAWDQLLAELNPAYQVVPRHQVYPDEEETREGINTRNEQMMVSSQSSAEIVALRAVGIDEDIVVAATVQDGPSDGVLEEGDILISINDVLIEEYTDAQDAVADTVEGESVTIRVIRDGEELDLDVTPETVETETADGGTEERRMVGIMMGSQFAGDHTIAINAGNVGGPSAGLMFSLAIYDKLTPGELTGGLRFAGSGTIAEDGTVGAIGGVRQKLVGAAEDGSQYFLVPAGNCAEVVGHEPNGLDVIRVETFDEAVGVVEGLGNGEDVDLPRC